MVNCVIVVHNDPNSCDFKPQIYEKYTKTEKEDFYVVNADAKFIWIITR